MDHTVAMILKCSKHFLLFKNRRKNNEKVTINKVLANISLKINVMNVSCITVADTEKIITCYSLTIDEKQ